MTSPTMADARSVRADLSWLLAIVAAALFIRIYFPWSIVFTPTHVNLLETDAWYHLRVIENLVHQFPHRLRVDPYAMPGGEFLVVPPLFDYLVAGAAWIVGLGRPSDDLVRTFTVFAPPVLGGLTVVAVYIVARLASGSVAGLLAAALAAILPGHFLDRTLLGFADHHALESAVSALVLCCVALPLARPQPVVRAGVWLGVSLVVFRLTWTSSAMLVMVLAAWLVAHVALQSWRRGGIGDTPRIVGIAVAVALPCTLLFQGIEPFRANVHVAALVICALIALVAEAGRVGLRAGWWSPRRLVVIAIATLALSVAGFFLLFPVTASQGVGELLRFQYTNQDATTVIEARPLLLYNGAASLRPAWDYFRSGFILGLGGIAFLAIRWRRRAQPLDLFLVVWTLAMYAATIGVNRFGYYLVPAIAIVAGCVCAWVIETGQRAGGWWRGAAVVAVAAGAFGVNLVPAISTTVRPGGISSAWFPAFDWLRRHSEEPFSDASYYAARYDTGPLRSSSSAVLGWWDYGYEIMAAAHRVPTAIPTGRGGVHAAQFFTSVDDAQALEMLKPENERYIFVDELLPFAIATDGTLIGKFQAMTRWANVPQDRYFGSFLIREGGVDRFVFLFFENYYHLDGVPPGRWRRSCGAGDRHGRGLVDGREPHRRRSGTRGVVARAVLNLRGRRDAAQRARARQSRDRGPRSARERCAAPTRARPAACICDAGARDVWSRRGANI